MPTQQAITFGSNAFFFYARK